MFTFLSPLFLIGLAAAAIPLVVHLSRSRRQKKLRFSTTRFFTDQFLRSYRMSKLKEVGLLLARMALFALFAIALAQPLVLPKGRAFLTGKRAVVLVLDQSASMSYLEDGLSLFDRARLSAKEVLDGLRSGDTAAVVLAGRLADGPAVLFPEPTADLAAVRRAIDALSVSALGTDLAGAVDRAEQVAQTGAAASREVYVLSDLQDSGWEVRQAVAARQQESDVLFFLVSIRPETPQNLAVTALQYAAARPMAGIPFAFRPNVLNQGRAVRNAEVALYIDGRKVAQQSVAKIQPGRWALPLFHHTFDRGGWHTGYVAVEDDVLPSDNRRYFAFEVVDAIRVLAVNGAPSQVARLDELFFLQKALAAGGGSAVRVEDVTAGGLGSRIAFPLEKEAQRGPDLVILANVESVPPAAVEALEQYVDRGGALLVFLGDQASPQFYNQYLAGVNRLHGGLLPGRLQQIAGQPAGEQAYANIQFVDREHPALAAFHDPQFASLAGITFRAIWEVETTGGVVLMRAQTGEPLLVEKGFGKGRVLLSTAPCDRDWSNFPVRPAYLPWVHRLVAYLAQEPLGRQPFYTTGQRVPLPVSATAGTGRVVVRKPDGTPAATAPLEFTGTDQVGVYELTGEDGSRQTFVANLEGYESDLTYLDDVLAARDGVAAGFKDLLVDRPLVSFVDDPARLTEVSLNARRGFKLWDIFLVVVLLIALFEPWLANRISLRHYTTAGGKPTGLDAFVATDDRVQARAPASAERQATAGTRAPEEIVS